MTTITIPKESIDEKELIAIPRKEYEEFVSLRRVIPVFKPTHTELRILERGRKDFRQGKYIEWSKFKHELENLHQRPRRKTN